MLSTWSGMRYCCLRVMPLYSRAWPIYAVHMESLLYMCVLGTKCICKQLRQLGSVSQSDDTPTWFSQSVSQSDDTPTWFSQSVR